MLQRIFANFKRHVNNSVQNQPRVEQSPISIPVQVSRCEKTPFITPYDPNGFPAWQVRTRMGLDVLQKLLANMLWDMRILVVFRKPRNLAQLLMAPNRNPLNEPIRAINTLSGQPVTRKRWISNPENITGSDTDYPKRIN
jgi:hypothetical protein